MKTTVSFSSSLALSPIGECHQVSASAQTAIANAEVNASFCLRIIPILIREPLMKRPNHLPEVCPVVTYCLARSSPTTVSHEYSCPASWALFSQVHVFRIVSYCICFEFLPYLSEVAMVTKASDMPTLSRTSSDPSLGRRCSGKTLSWCIAIP